ncbi:MAG: glycosyltransferase [Humidesulfovibrio sp.]|uniref:glycosyltransferase n=1 Tax=Humidesulfovibrio sp. TaxID=2910988 RepID=UPI0027F15AC1|nr:glycosyltransferase [Humidesulfovibrio sp.]MDQ7835399.1 glycosyltransferase [Humidesulfovibrio sp.]
MSAPLAQSLTGAWDALPEPVRRRLALSSTGWRHLAQAGALCLGLARGAGEPSEHARLTALAAELVLWAWGENPLSGPLAAEILSAPELPLPEASRAGLAAVADNWRVPEAKDGGLAYFERLAKQRDTQKLADFLAVQVQKAPTALFWREKALALALYAAEPDVRAALETTALGGLDAAPALAPVAGTLKAQAAFLRGDTAACLDSLRTLDGLFGPGFAPARAGLALLAAGDEPAAAAPLLRALKAAPWQANLAQVAADAASGLRRELAPLPGPALIMLYTWNKAADLDATLASLLHSDLHGAKVMVLDNGSTDATPQVLDAWANRAGENLLRVTLPINIGAPAARNWLAATPEAKAADVLIYLDDDVALSRDWLGRLGAALRRHPEAGVVGCKVADHHAPHLLQNVAGHLVIPADAPCDENGDRPDLDFQSLTPNPFRLCDAHLQGPDWGLFDFVSPCASVTGCCHLFRREAIHAPNAAGGGFSLALGPSQYDDFERDLRMLDSGSNAVYTGHLRVGHRKRSGLASQAEAAGAGAAGNRYKMQCMHPRQEIARHIEAQAQRLEAHLTAGLALLDTTYSEGPDA